MRFFRGALPFLLPVRLAARLSASPGASSKTSSGTPLGTLLARITTPGGPRGRLRAACRTRGGPRRAQARLCVLLARKPRHQAQRLARAGTRGGSHAGQMGIEPRQQSRARIPEQRRDRHRLDGGPGRGAGPRERQPDPHGVYLFASRVDRARRAQGLADPVRRGSQGQEDRRDQGHRSLPVHAARAARRRPVRATTSRS